MYFFILCIKSLVGSNSDQKVMFSSFIDLKFNLLGRYFEDKIFQNLNIILTALGKPAKNSA